MLQLLHRAVKTDVEAFQINLCSQFGANATTLVRSTISRGFHTDASTNSTFVCIYLITLHNTGTKQCTEIEEQAGHKTTSSILKYAKFGAIEQSKSIINVSQFPKWLH